MPLCWTERRRFFRFARIAQCTQSIRARLVSIQATSPLSSSGACTEIQSPRRRMTPRIRGEPHSVRDDSRMRTAPPGFLYSVVLPVAEAMEKHESGSGSDGNGASKGPPS